MILSFSLRDFRKRFLEGMTPIKTMAKIGGYIIRSGAAALLLLGAQTSLAGSARWLLSPQDSAWENLSNWTAGGPPNGPSDTATFGPSSQTDVNISTSVELNSIVFTFDSDSFILNISPFCFGCPPSPPVGGELIISGTGIRQDSSVLQTFVVGDAGQIIFNNTSTAGDATIINSGGIMSQVGSQTIFNDSSTAGSAILVAGGGYYGASGGILFNGTSTGGTAQVSVSRGGSGNSPSGYLDISGHEADMTIGSIEGGGGVRLGANDLTVGTNNINTTFFGVIGNDGHRGSLAKVGSGVLTLQSNNCISDTVGLSLVSGSIIKLDFTGPPDLIASLVVDGVSQPPGIYGGPMSGAPNILPEFAGSGTVKVGSILGNISTRAFVQTGDNVMIGGFIVQGTEPKEVVIRAIGPELTQYGVPNALADPRLELHDASGALIASNNDWQHTIIGGIITGDQVVQIQVSGYAPADNSESAMIVSLPPGNYTAIVLGVNNTTGVALVEVYDRFPAPNSILSNISTRSFVQTGDNVMIGGFIVQGTQPKKVILRAIGPELSQFGVPNPLADPTLELHDSTGALIASNDNWMTTIIGGIITSDQVQDIRDSGHAPTDPSESAIIAELPPGNYTAIVRGVNETTGVGLVEVYDLD
jgi:hypothetical protein